MGKAVSIIEPTAEQKDSFFKKNDKTTIFRNSDSYESDPTNSNGLIPQIPFGGVPQSSQLTQISQDTSGALLTLNRSILSNAFVRYGVLQTVVCLPVEDAFRGGIVPSSRQLNHAELKKLNREFERRFLTKIKKAMQWCSLYGGGILIINTDADPATPFSEDEIGESTPFELISADRWEITYPYTTYELFDEDYWFSYYGQRIHSSRVIRLIGEEAPSFIRQRLQGWGISVIERGLREMNTYGKNWNVIFELIDEAKIDVVKIMGLNDAMAANVSNAGSAVTQRLAIASQTKNYNSLLALDSEDDFIQKQLSFSGLSEVLKHIQVAMAATFRFPTTKLFGLSAAGFNAGDDDIENYNSMVEGEHRFKARQILLRILPLLAKNIFGIAPDDLDFSFKPLRILSAEQEETIKNFKFERYSRLFAEGAITLKQYLSSIKAENIVTLEDDEGADENA